MHFNKQAEHEHILPFRGPEPSCCHLSLSPVSHPLQFCVSDSGACVKSVWVLWRSPLCRERACRRLHPYSPSRLYYTAMLIPKGLPFITAEHPSPQLSQSPSPGGSLFLFCSEQPSLGSDAEGRCWVCTVSILADFPAALHGFCTVQASNQRLTLIPRLNSYQCLPIVWVKKLNPFLNLYFPVCQWGFHVYIGHFIPAALSCLFLH